MLSILIPIYNIDCRDLVGRLQGQCVKLDIDFEIICIDDASELRFKTLNCQLKTLEFISYTELNENIGRAKIRNMLAENARFDILLFLDADSAITRVDFIEKYISLAGNKTVIYGGTEYAAIKPVSKDMVLHWKYAKKHEALSHDKRLKTPFLSFMSNNFVITKQIFEKLRFDADHKGYGYEDTLFAFQLKKIGVNISHIDNPVLHLGLIKADVFLSRTIEAMRNLAELYRAGKIPATRIISFHHRLNRLGIAGLTTRLIGSILPLVSKNLKSGNPYVPFFQIYKYYYFYKYANLSD
jgi:glycosyltransferase involved in cell wall biosynthesis